MGWNSLLDVLKKVQRENPLLKQRVTEAQALTRWEAAVGSVIAKHTRAIRVQEKVLWVEVDHPIWKSELVHRKRQILEILNRAAEPTGPIEILEDILFLDPRAPLSEERKAAYKAKYQAERAAANASGASARPRKPRGR
jgi:predicted nucleic acid-binding Zn ribbon protein